MSSVSSTESVFSVFSVLPDNKDSISSDCDVLSISVFSSDKLLFNIFWETANWSIIWIVWETSVSFSSDTSQNSNFATPCNNFLTLSGLSTPGNSIWILPVPCNLWIFGWDVPNLSILVLKMLKDLSIALSTSSLIMSKISESEESNPILPLLETVAKIWAKFFCGAIVLNSE